MTPADLLVQDYLGRLDRAATSLPPDRRTELLAGIGEHVADARADGAGDDESAVRTVLDRLGSPEEIVASAYDAGAAPAWAPDPARTPPRPGTGLEVAAVVLLTAGSLVPVVGWLAGVALLWTSRLWRGREKVLGTLVVPFGPGGVLLLGALLPFGPSQVCTQAPQVQPGTGGPDVAPPPPADLAPPPPALPAPPADLAPPPSGDLATTSGSCVLTGPPGWVQAGVQVLLALAALAVAVHLLRTARRRAEAATPDPAAYRPGGPAAPTPWGPLEVAGVAVLALGGFVAPVVGALVGFVLVCCSPRWAVCEKAIAGALAVLPALLPLSALVVGRSLL